MLTLKAISPKLPLLKNPIPKVESRMRQFGGDGVKLMAKYPTKRAPTKRIRTGRLGQGWRYRYAREGGDLVTYVENPVEYAAYVQGARQAAVMRGYGWQTVDDELKPVWEDAVKDIAAMFGDSVH